MPPIKLLIHNVANAIDADENEIQQICGQYGLIRPGKAYIQLGDKPDHIFFDEISLQEEENLSRGMLFRNPFAGNELQRLIDENDICEIKDYVRTVRANLELCSKGTFPLLSISDMFKRLSQKFTIAPKANFPWNVTIELAEADQNGKLSLQDFVDLYGFLMPSLDASNPIRLEYTKICRCCGSYYQAKGPKAIYCSERCRSRARFTNDKKYMEEKRIKIPKK